MHRYRSIDWLVSDGLTEDLVTKLNQIVAIEKGVKTTSGRALTDAYHTIQKAPLLSGISRTYRPKDDDGDQLPPESTLVQTKVADVLKDVAGAMTRLFDVVATKDVTNCSAKADVKLPDGTVILSQAPVTYLLWLEKQLVDLHTFVGKLPTLDPSERWTYDANTGAYVTEPTETTRTKKVPRNWVKAEATDKHPAQVEVYHEDIVVGYWTTVKFSGASPADVVRQMQDRVNTLIEAVKKAREEANSVEVTDINVGDQIFGYLFGV
jgi:hypothetical protein